MIEQVFYYIVGGLAVSFFVLAWFATNLPMHVFHKGLKNASEFGIDHPENATWLDWSEWVQDKYGVFGELLTCSVCFSFWVSCAVAVFMILLGIIPVSIGILGWLSWGVFPHALFRGLGEG